jgi:PEP-CTERM motif-containing protein
MMRRRTVGSAGCAALAATSLIAALAVSSPALASPYTLELTGVGDGANDGSVYFSPYVGTIRDASNQVIYSGYIICDDFLTHADLGSSWGATETNAGNLNGTEKFAGETYLFNGTLYDTAQMYDAAAYLANELLQPGNVTNWTAQGDLSFAIWDIFDGTTPSLGSATWSDIDGAFNAVVNSGYVGSNVEVYTPSPLDASQEFLVPVPEPSTLALFAMGFIALIGFGARARPAASRSR